VALRVARRKSREALHRARVDARTKRLLLRIQPGEIAVIDHEDLDRVAAEGLVDRGVAAVVNASRSISGRYPNRGPLILVEAGIPLIDSVGKLLMTKVQEGDTLRIEGDRVFVGDRLVGIGIRQTSTSIGAAMEASQQRLADQFESFAANTLEFISRERDLLFGGLGLPALEHQFTGRHVLVVVRGTSYKEDLAALRPYIRDVQPVMIGVDGGADALLEEGYRPDIILGDMDSVSEHALRMGLPRPRRRRLADLLRGRWRTRPAEIVVHAYANGTAPGAERVTALGVPFTTFIVSGTSEDAAFLMAHGLGAALIVAVGSHGTLREFLDKGRLGMASTFLARLRIGDILVDAKGVSRLYRGAARPRDAWLLLAAVVVLFVVIVLVSPALRLEVRLLWESFRTWLFHIRSGV
jgi:uncharacterized membrane-anchored protein